MQPTPPGGWVDDPTDTNRSNGYVGYVSYNGAMPKVRHDHGPSGRYATPDRNANGKTHVPLCQVQSN